MAHKKLTTILGRETKKCGKDVVFLAAIVFIIELEKVNCTVVENYQKIYALK